MLSWLRVVGARRAVGVSDGLKVEAGIRQGSARNTFLFASVMDSLTHEIRQETPRTVMLADNILICSERREHVKSLEKWRHALGRGEMKISREK